MPKSGYGNLPVPAALTRGYDLRVIDYTELELLLVAEGAAGSATAFESTDDLQQNTWWRVERIVVSSDTAAADVELVVYLGTDARMSRARDWTPMPPGSAAISEYPSYLTIYPTSCLSFGITGANPGDQFFVSAQYQVVTKILSRPAA